MGQMTFDRFPHTRGQWPQLPEQPTAEPLAEGWDLHCHTVFSDGTLSPLGLVQQGLSAGLAGAAITDHDTTAGWADASVAARKNHFPLLRGSEITADHHGISVHLLAYLYVPNTPVLSALFARTREQRVERTRQMVERLSKDYPITWDDVVAQAKKGGDTTIGRPHVADALVAAGVYPDRSAAFAAAIGGQSKYFIPVRSPAVEEVLDAVKLAGGVVFVAHPAAKARNRVLLSDEDIQSFADHGLDGIEVRHRDNSPEQQIRLTAVAERLGLLVSGGSDWHGAGKPNQLGENRTNWETVAEIVRRGAIEIVG